MPDRELLLERLERLAIVLDELMPQCAELVRDALALLKEQEAVVRCKDCKFRGNINICPLAYIEKTEQFTALCVDKWFCGSGKRK